MRYPANDNIPLKLKLRTKKKRSLPCELYVAFPPKLMFLKVFTPENGDDLALQLGFLSPALQMLHNPPVVRHSLGTTVLPALQAGCKHVFIPLLMSYFKAKHAAFLDLSSLYNAFISYVKVKL